MLLQRPGLDHRTPLLVRATRKVSHIVLYIKERRPYMMHISGNLTLTQMVGVILESLVFNKSKRTFETARSMYRALFDRKPR